MGDGDPDREPTAAPPWPPADWPEAGSAPVAGHRRPPRREPRTRVSPTVFVFGAAVVAVACASVAFGLWAASLGSPGPDDAHASESRPASSTTLMDALASPQSRMMVVDVQGLETEALPDVLKVEAGDGLGLDLAAAEAAQKVAIEEQGMTILERGRAQTGLGETAWTVADAAGATGLDGLQIVDYAAMVDGTMWKATYWTDRMPQGRELADVMMASFTLL